MIRAGLLGVFFGMVTLAGWAQLDGPASTGVSASLIRLFGTNQNFAAQAEMQMLDHTNQELLGVPMRFARAGNKIRVEVDLAQMRNKLHPDATAQMRPLGLDQTVSIIRPETRTNLICFPKLKACLQLRMPANEADAFLKRARVDRANLGREKMQGYQCLKQRVTITDASGQKSEATVWVAPELRNFPVCVATREKEGVVMMRFRQVKFDAVDAAQFEPPAGYASFTDLQMLIAGPGTQYMRANGTGLKSSSSAQTQTRLPASRSTTASHARKK